MDVSQVLASEASRKSKLVAGLWANVCISTSSQLTITTTTHSFSKCICFKKKTKVHRPFGQDKENCTCLHEGLKLLYKNNINILSVDQDVTQVPHSNV